jgi:predicted acyltransferase (DUF342 family)
MSDRTTHKLVVSYARMILPRGLASVGGLYATEFVCGGESGVFRALLGERDVVLGRNSIVLRWIHSDANLTVEEGSVLHGRASAERRLMLALDTQFERVYGRPIMSGTTFDGACPARPALVTFNPAQALDRSPSRTIVDDDLEIAPGSLVEGNLVVRGSLVVGAGSTVNGSLKSHGAMTIGPYARITGSVVSSRDIEVQEGAMIGGPVIAEGDVLLGEGVVVGEYFIPATVTAECVVVRPGVAVFGTIWTRQGGMVRAAATSGSSAA